MVQALTTAPATRRSSRGTNVAWTAAVPYGQSSPIVADKRLYLTAIEGDGSSPSRLDARTGKELWRRELETQSDSGRLQSQ